MNDNSLIIDGEHSRKLTVKLTNAEYTALSALSQFGSYSSPSSFVRDLVRKKLCGSQDIAPAPESGTLNSNFVAFYGELKNTLAQIEYRSAGLATVLERISNGTADTPSQIRLIEALIRKALFQATTASYMSIEIWRLLAADTQLPRHALPPSMVADIQKLNLRIAAEAEADASN